MAITNLFRVRAVLVAMVVAALVAVLVAHGTASAQSTPGTTITVNTTLDEETPSTDGECSLREAIFNANSGEKWPFPDCAAGASGLDAPQTINFSEGLSGQITLGSELPAIDAPLALTIDGTNARITISGNSAHRVLSVGSGAQLTLRNLTVADGKANSGGGIYNVGTLKVLSSTFTQNTAAVEFGGGIFNGGTLTITNSTFSGNRAETLAGGIFSNTGAHLTVTHATFWNNTHRAPQRGGAILSAGTATLSNTILAGSSFSENCSEEGITDGGYNISDDASCDFNQSTSKNNTDPKLTSTLANNGGPTQTIALTKDSPALNAIPTGQSGCATTADRVTTDQRGVKRPQGEGCDIGAFEADDRAPTVRTVVPAENATGISPGVNLTATFSEKLDRATLTKSTFKLFRVDANGNTTQVTDVTVTPTTDGTQVVLNPFGTTSRELAANRKYRAVVTTGAKDLSGNRLDQNRKQPNNQPMEWFFSTGTS